jgi:hypothetical protein
MTRDWFPRKKVPGELSLEGLEPLYWARIAPNKKIALKCHFFDLSKGKPDPPFYYLGVSKEQEPLFEEYYLVCYFDSQGNWITQTPFETFDEVLRHGELSFGVEECHWYWCGTDDWE